MTGVTKHALGTAGLPILYGLSHIVPVTVGNADRCNAASNLRLNRHNFSGFTMKVMSLVWSSRVKDEPSPECIPPRCASRRKSKGYAPCGLVQLVARDRGVDAIVDDATR